MMALALVPAEHVHSLFSYLRQEINDDERETLANLFKYFDDQWIRQIAIWNVFEVPDRTNNYSEGILKQRLGEK